MNYHDIDWLACFRAQAESADREPAGSERSRQMWDEKAPSFARKPQRSDYINQLIRLLALKPDETVFDMGCGSGTLAVPLAQSGHNVCAVDFSRGMLDELRMAANATGIAVSSNDGAAESGSSRPASTDKSTDATKPAGTITVFQRSWQESWDDLPKADVAISSRSLVTTDLADAVRKLETHAASRVVITTGAGDLPYRDHRILAAMGRAEEAAMDPLQLVTILNYLFEIGRLPRVDYIAFPGVWHRATREELEETIRHSHEPQDAAEEQALATYLERHVVFNEGQQRFELDYPRTDRWAYVEWSVVR